MTDRNRGSRRFGVSTRRATAWSAGPGSSVLTSISTSSSGFLGASIQGTEQGLTMIRIRGQLNAALDVFTSVGDGYQGAVGIGIASLAAVTAGIGSVPTPLTEQDSDNWMWWHPLSVHGGLALASETRGHQVLEIDTKAMRKFPTDLSIYMAFEVVEIGTAVLSIFADTRALAKLS